LYIFWFHSYTGLSYGWRDLACPAMQSVPENCLGSMSAVCVSQTDFTLGDETNLERMAVPNPSTVTSHSNSAQHQLVWS